MIFLTRTHRSNSSKVISPSGLPIRKEEERRIFLILKSDKQIDFAEKQQRTTNQRIALPISQSFPPMHVVSLI